MVSHGHCRNCGGGGVIPAAQANFYVQGDVGFSKVKTSGLESGEISKIGFSPSLAVGYDFGDWRLALDYTKYRNAKYQYFDEYGDFGTTTEVEGAGKLKTQGFGLSVIYDIDLKSDLEPYVGIRLSSNQIKFSETHIEIGRIGPYENYKYTGSESDKSTKFGYGVVAGVSYKFTPNLAADLGLQYNRLGKLDDVKVNQYGAKIGLRYEF